MGGPHVVAEELQEPAHSPGGVDVVINHEDARAPALGVSGLSGRVGLRQRRGNGGQPNDELAPLAGPLAGRYDRPAVHLGEALHERQTNAEPALRARSERSP